MSGVIRPSGRPPHPAQVMLRLDLQAKTAMAGARTAAVNAVRAQGPGSFGGSSIRGSNRKTPTGYEVIVRPIKTKRHIAQLVSGGTGIYGPHRRRIKPRRAKAFRIGGREFASMAGQRANPFFERARPSARAVASIAITRPATKLTESLTRVRT